LGRRPRCTVANVASYDVTTRIGFIANNKRKTLVHIYQEDIYKLPPVGIFLQLVEGLAIMAIL
jgi:hypothetical protein